MSFVDFIAGSLVSGSFIIIFILYIFIKNPEKVERWASMILKIFAYFSKRAEKKRIETYVNSNIEIGRKKVEKELPGSMPFGVEIEFLDGNEEKVYQRDGVLVLKMKTHRSDSENLATATAYFVSHGLLPYSKRYVDEDIAKGIDFVISKDMLKNDHIALSFLRNIFTDSLDDNSFSEIINKIEKIHEEGLLTRICMREFQKFGALFPKEPNNDTKIESKKFLENVFSFVNKNRGENIKLEFDGKFINLRIVPLISKYQYGIDNHYKFIEHSIRKGWKNFYIVAAGRNVEDGEIFVDLLISDKHLGLHEEFRDIYKGKYHGTNKQIFVSLVRKIDKK